MNKEELLPRLRSLAALMKSNPQQATKDLKILTDTIRDEGEAVSLTDIAGRLNWYYQFDRMHFKATKRVLTLMVDPGSETSPEYAIEFCRMRNAGSVLGWLEHLSEKNWFTLTHARMLIAQAANRGVEVIHA